MDPTIPRQRRPAMVVGQLRHEGIERTVPTLWQVKGSVERKKVKSSGPLLTEGGCHTCFQHSGTLTARPPCDVSL